VGGDRNAASEQWDHRPKARYFDPRPHPDNRPEVKRFKALREYNAPRSGANKRSHVRHSSSSSRIDTPGMSSIGEDEVEPASGASSFLEKESLEDAPSASGKKNSSGRSRGDRQRSFPNPTQAKIVSKAASAGKLGTPAETALPKAAEAPKTENTAAKELEEIADQQVISQLMDESAQNMGEQLSGRSRAEKTQPKTVRGANKPQVGKKTGSSGSQKQSWSVSRLGTKVATNAKAGAQSSGKKRSGTPSGKLKKASSSSVAAKESSTKDSDDANSKLANAFARMFYDLDYSGGGAASGADSGASSLTSPKTTAAEKSSPANDAVPHGTVAKKSRIRKYSAKPTNGNQHENGGAQASSAKAPPKKSSSAVNRKEAKEDSTAESDFLTQNVDTKQQERSADDDDYTAAAKKALKHVSATPKKDKSKTLSSASKKDTHGHKDHSKKSSGKKQKGPSSDHQGPKRKHEKRSRAATAKQNDANDDDDGNDGENEEAQEGEDHEGHEGEDHEGHEGEDHGEEHEGGENAEDNANPQGDGSGDESHENGHEDENGHAGDSDHGDDSPEGGDGDGDGDTGGDGDYTGDGELNGDGDGGLDRHKQKGHNQNAMKKKKVERTRTGSSPRAGASSRAATTRQNANSKKSPVTNKPQQANQNNPQQNPQASQQSSDAQQQQQVPQQPPSSNGSGGPQIVRRGPIPQRVAASSYNPLVAPAPPYLKDYIERERARAAGEDLTKGPKLKGTIVVPNMHPERAQFGVTSGSGSSEKPKFIKSNTSTQKKNLNSGQSPSADGNSGAYSQSARAGSAGNPGDGGTQTFHPDKRENANDAASNANSDRNGNGSGSGNGSNSGAVASSNGSNSGTGPSPSQRASPQNVPASRQQAPKQAPSGSGSGANSNSNVGSGSGNNAGSSSGSGMGSGSNAGRGSNGGSGSSQGPRLIMAMANGRPRSVGSGSGSSGSGSGSSGSGSGSGNQGQANDNGGSSGSGEQGNNGGSGSANSANGSGARSYENLGSGSGANMNDQGPSGSGARTNGSSSGSGSAASNPLLDNWEKIESLAANLGSGLQGGAKDAVMAQFENFKNTVLKQARESVKPLSPREPNGPPFPSKESMNPGQPVLEFTQNTTESLKHRHKPSAETSRRWNEVLKKRREGGLEGCLDRGRKYNTGSDDPRGTSSEEDSFPCAAFKDASELAPRLAAMPAEPEQLEMFALYKQATIGDCKVIQPEEESPNGLTLAEWDVWHGKFGMPRTKAAELYIQLVENLRKQYGKRAPDLPLLDLTIFASRGGIAAAPPIVAGDTEDPIKLQEVADEKKEEKTLWGPQKSYKDLDKAKKRVSSVNFNNKARAKILEKQAKKHKLAAEASKGSS